MYGAEFSESTYPLSFWLEPYSLTFFDILDAYANTTLLQSALHVSDAAGLGELTFDKGLVGN